MAYTKITTSQVDKESPNDATLMGIIKDNFNYIMENNMFGPSDYTCPVFMDTYGTGWVVDGQYHRVSTLITLPTPPTGKRWRMTVRFYFTRSGSNTNFRYYLQIYDWEGDSSVSIADTTLDGTGARWVTHELYSATAFSKRYLNLKGNENSGHYCNYKTPTVMVDLVDV